MAILRNSLLRAIGMLGALVLSVGALSAHAAVLAQWDPSGTVQSSSPLAPTSAASGLSAGNLTLGPGLSDPGPFANVFMGNNWPSGGLDANDYLAFSITGNATYQSVVFSLYNNFDGIGNWELRSSVDGFTSTLASGSFSGIFGGGEVISADVSALGTVNGTLTFRLYTDSNAGTTNPLQRGIRGTGGGGEGLTVNGTANGGGTVPFVTPLPVPALAGAPLLALMGLIAFAALSLRRRIRR